MEPTEGNILSGSYWLTRGLYMNTRGQPDGIVKAFVDYVMSDDMKGFIREDGYIPTSGVSD